LGVILTGFADREAMGFDEDGCDIDRFGTGLATEITGSEDGISCSRSDIGSGLWTEFMLRSMLNSDRRRSDKIRA
jgi:hypothetical protein